MEHPTTSKQERQYYIDWLRIILILSVFLFHIGMVFNTWGWHVKNEQTYGGFLKWAMAFLHEWRMPLLFLISGAGTYYALGKRSTGQYLGERLKRLMLPFLAGIFILVPVQVYIEKAEQFDSLLNFYPHMFEGIYPTGNFSWHHLWFILYLFVISLVISPFLKFLRSKRYMKLNKQMEKLFSKPLTLNVFLIPLIGSQLLLRPYFPEDTHALFNDWAAISFFILFFLAGFMLLSSGNISDSIKKQRRFYLVQSFLVTALMFTLPSQLRNRETGDLLWGLLSIIVAWSCSLTAIGYAKRYLNKDHRLRKSANEAIYPFYLLHQPVIVVVASLITEWDLATGWKVLLITGISFSLTIMIYRVLIYPINFMRIIFGMKALPSGQAAPESVRAPSYWKSAGSVPPWVKRQSQHQISDFR
jgi:peptidoglycan/LPS O-acetylase OafA/YrhL